MLLWDLLGKFPGTDYESFNYDWVIRKLKELKDSVAAAKASEDAALESEHEAESAAGFAFTYRNQAKGFRDEAAESAASIEGLAGQISTNSARIDNLIANAGDGTIPSELTDIRIGYNGVAYVTAGDAVRGQAESNAINLDNMAEELAAGENLHKTTLLNACVMGDVHSSGYDIYNPHTSTNTCYYKEYFPNDVAIYFDDSTYNVLLSGYDENKQYLVVDTFTTSPAIPAKAVNHVLHTAPYIAVEFRNKNASTLDNSAVNSSGAYAVTLFATNENNARLTMLTSSITDLKLTNLNLVDNPNRINNANVTPTADGYTIAAGGYMFPEILTERMNDKMFLAYSADFDGDMYFGWKTGPDTTYKPYTKLNKTGNVFWYEVEKANAPAGAYILQFRIDNRDNDTAMHVSNVLLTDGVYTKLDDPARIAYVAGNGDDANSGITRSAPFATIQKAIDQGFKTILVKEGVYTDGITMNGLAGVEILLDKYYSNFTPHIDEDDPKIIIDATNKQTGIMIQNCNDCTFENIEVENSTVQGWEIEKNADLVFKNCIAHDIAIGGTSGGGFVITHTDADFYNCGAYNIGVTTASTEPTYHLDGFNIHETGTTNFYDCWAYNCMDDGVSHHDACTGTIRGGEWYGCGKGGVASPTHGAAVDIYDAYAHDNGYGIYAHWDGSVLTSRRNIKISNCVCKNNRTKDISVNPNYYTAKVWNCIYDTSEGFTPIA